MKYITRKSLLYKTGVEYGDYTLNHIEGCSHGCRYPCYAMMMAKRFGRIKSYDDWVHPKIVENALELLEKEIPRYKAKIKSVHLCFTTDPFMYKLHDISELSIRIIKELNDKKIKCTVLTKGVLPTELEHLSKHNEIGISLISLDEDFRMCYEPQSAPYNKRIDSLYHLHKKGLKTWVSIEPYPTPNIINQDINDIIKSISFVDKIIFGRLNYNKLVSQYNGYKDFYNDLSYKIIDFCIKSNKEYHIKEGTFSNIAQESC